MLINDGFLSLNLNDVHLTEDKFWTESSSKSNMQDFMLGNYNLFDMMKQFWATCHHSYHNISNKPPLINAVIHRISENPFNQDIKKGLVLLLIKDYESKVDNIFEGWKRK